MPPLRLSKTAHFAAEAAFAEAGAMREMRRLEALCQHREAARLRAEAAARIAGRMAAPAEEADPAVG